MSVHVLEQDPRQVAKAQKMAAFLAFLEANQVFDTRSGSVQLTINFDALGGIGSVQIQTTKHYRL